MFRKGGDWEAGAELLLVLRPTQEDQAGIDSAFAFMQRLAAAARELRSEALQASVGTVLRHTCQLQVGEEEHICVLAACVIVLSHAHLSAVAQAVPTVITQ